MQRSAVRAPVMSDVARLAGVSHQTVSRVINGHPNISPSTRAKVQRAIDRLGYRPNTAARALVRGAREWSASSPPRGRSSARACTARGRARRPGRPASRWPRSTSSR